LDSPIDDDDRGIGSAHLVQYENSPKGLGLCFTVALNEDTA